MIVVDRGRCTGCRLCVRECPVGAMVMEQRLAVVGSACVECGLCVRLCSRDALARNNDEQEPRVQCDSCPISCLIPAGFKGACRRYTNRGGKLVLETPLLVPSRRGPRNVTVLEPLLTGVGVGTASPCFTPAPHIVAAEIADVDVVTVVSEVPLSYSGLKLKVDTNVFVGEEGARVRRDGRPIGRVETQEYGSKMLGLAGLDAVHGPNGATATRTVEDICNRQRVELKIEKGARLSVVLGEPPEVDGVVSGPMRVGCGSATVAMFGPALKAVADEVLVLDPDITGLLSEHLAGRGLGMTWSGLIPAGDRSTIGRYFGEAGSGIGGTRFTDPREAVASVDPDVARPGMTVFITETAGELGFLFRLNDSLELEPVPLSPEAHRAMALIRENSEPSRVSALFVAGLGGSARSGVTRFPIKLNEAVRAGTVRLTVGGAPVFLLPGGGITILVDVEKLPAGAITRVPSPAMVAPVEYTMTRETYALIEGHVDNVRPLDVVLGERSHRFTAESPSQFVQSRPIRM